jgi:hypothetical protein
MCSTYSEFSFQEMPRGKGKASQPAIGSNPWRKPKLRHSHLNGIGISQETPIRCCRGTRFRDNSRTGIAFFYPSLHFFLCFPQNEEPANQIGNKFIPNLAYNQPNWGIPLPPSERGKESPRKSSAASQQLKNLPTHRIREFRSRRAATSAASRAGVVRERFGWRRWTWRRRRGHPSRRGGRCCCCAAAAAISSASRDGVVRERFGWRRWRRRRGLTSRCGGRCCCAVAVAASASATCASSRAGVGSEPEPQSLFWR